VIFSNEVCSTSTVMSSQTLLSDLLGPLLEALCSLQVIYCHVMITSRVLYCTTRVLYFDIPMQTPQPSPIWS
jgi:hypothetical protein